MNKDRRVKHIRKLLQEGKQTSEIRQAIGIIKPSTFYSLCAKHKIKLNNNKTKSGGGSRLGCYDKKPRKKRTDKKKPIVIVRGGGGNFLEKFQKEIAGIDEAIKLGNKNHVPNFHFE